MLLESLFGNKKLKENIYLLTLLCVILPVLIIQNIGLLQPLELAHYDSLFLLRQPESTDTDIVIVEWDENSIRKLNEPMLSDYTLVKALEKIMEQQPKIVGLDLYRDLPVAKSGLDNLENLSANKTLQTIFTQYSEIIGIQKILPPSTSPPMVLEEQQRVAASDLPIDPDYRTRRAYIFPLADEDGVGVGLPYIGFVLGYKFLESDGWQAENLPWGIGLHYSETKKLAIKTVDRRYLFSNGGLSYLINWRTAKKAQNFIRISLNDLVERKIAPSLFSDRLVIIGNTTGYSGDTHNTPINRWNSNTPYTNGVDIVAHVASSLINAAQENRALLRICPLWLEFTLLAGSCFSLSRLGQCYLLRRNTLIGIRYTSLIFSFTLISILWFVSCCLFDLFGLWLNITPTCLAVAWSWIILVNFCQLIKDSRDFSYLKLLIKDFKHSIGSISAHISSSNRGIIRKTNELEQILERERRIEGVDEFEFACSDPGVCLESINLRTRNIKQEVSRIQKYQQRTSNFLQYTYSNDFSSQKKVDLNQILSQIARNCIDEYGNTKVRLYCELDDTIPQLTIYPNDLQIVVENLVCNALHALQSEEEPWIKISSINHRRSVKLVFEDNGIGMTSSQQEKIFLPFQSYRQGGQGIGLFLVQQVVQNRGGLIKVESKVGQGTKFHLKLIK